MKIRYTYHKIQPETCFMHMVFQVGSDNPRQKCWDTLSEVVYTRPPIPPYNVEISCFTFLHVAVPNIAWWGKGGYGMIGKSVAFLAKKELFQQVKSNVSTGNIIRQFCVGVPTTFGEDCL